MGAVVAIVFVFLTLVALVIFGFWNSSVVSRKRAQKRINGEIENAIILGLADLRIEHLARHSDKEKIARIVSAKIRDYLKMAVHPEKLSFLLQEMDLFTKKRKRNRLSSREIELAGLIEQEILRTIDSHVLQVYQLDVGQDAQRGFYALNQSFLVHAEKNGFIMELQLN